MNKQDLQQAFSAVHVPEDTLQAVLQREATKKKGGHRPLVWKLAACAAAIAILLTALLFWPAGSPGGDRQIVALPGVMKVYACEMDSVAKEDLEKYAITDERGYFATIHIPGTSASFQIPISFVISEEYWGECEITFRTVSEYEGFFQNLTITNGNSVNLKSHEMANSVASVYNQVGANGEFFVDIIVYADEKIVGYGVLSFCFVDGSCYAYQFFTECFPMVDGEMQDISMEYIQKEMCAYKQAQKPGEGAEYIRHVLEEHK